LFQIAIRCGDHARVNFDRLAAAYSFKLSLLQNTEQLNLRVERQLGDFVEKNRTAVS
jgi:hypothetical protein